MKSILRFPLKPIGSQTLELPQGAKILSCQVQDQIPYIFALADTDAVSKDLRTIEVYIANQEFPDDRVERRFIGSIHAELLNQVFHVFERRWY